MVEAPIHTIIGSVMRFLWGKGEWTYLKELKKKIIQEPLLVLIHLQYFSDMETNVSGYVMGVILV